MKRSTLAALIITGAVTLWILSGMVFTDKEDSRTTAAATLSDEEFSVLAETSVAAPYVADLVIRGRTEALRKVQLRSEIEAAVVETPVEKGNRVNEGTLICRLAVNDRAAQLNQAKALAAQRRLELDAAQELAAKGHRSANQVAAAQAAFDAARAQVELWQVQLANTELRAPFAGLVETRPAEVGDFLQKGGACATLIFEDPFLVVGEVSEQDVGTIRAGQTARVQMIDGTRMAGTVRYVSAAAQERTRTFRVEVEVPNPDLSLRDGMTADIVIPVESTTAHHVSPSLLVLGQTGDLGVRAVTTDGTVEFHQVDIIGDDETGVWVEGLPESVNLIVTGHEYVVAGDKVGVRMKGVSAS